MNNQKGFGLIGLIIALAIIMLLVAGKAGYLDRWLGDNKKSGIGQTLHPVSRGYVETQVGLGEQAKAQIKDIQKTLNDKYN